MGSQYHGGLTNVPPVYSADNSADRVRLNSELFSEIKGFSSALLEPANLNDLFNRQKRILNRLSASLLISWQSSLARRILHVVISISREQVLWPNAWRIVAFMKDKQFLANWAVRKNPGYAVSPRIRPITGPKAITHITRDKEQAISTGLCSESSPNPTRPEFGSDYGAVFVDVTPETNLEWDSWLTVLGYNLCGTFIAAKTLIWMCIENGERLLAKLAETLSYDMIPSGHSDLQSGSLSRAVVSVQPLRRPVFII